MHIFQGTFVKVKSGMGKGKMGKGKWKNKMKIWKDKVHLIYYLPTSILNLDIHSFITSHHLFLTKLKFKNSKTKKIKQKLKLITEN